ncbi:F17 fimbrial protein [Salmonella enterica subsp. enterica]|nr:F17 fimbrial protein [Salmonella enterica subsp. enterica]
MGSSYAYDGTINFVGKVVDQTCSVKAGTDNLTVTLPTVSKTALDADTKTASLTPFSIQLTGCATGKADAGTVKAYFEPNATTDFNTGNLTNTGTAQNVQIQLLNANGTTPIKLGQDISAQNVSGEAINGGDVTLRYNAQYYATGAADAGDVAATVNYTVAYE